MSLFFVAFVVIFSFELGWCQFNSGNACATLKYRPVDGSCNNIANPQWGRTGTPFARFIPPDYADSRGSARVSDSGNQLSGARVVSLNLVTDADDDDHPSASHMLMQWGQFINHDVTKKRTQSNPCCDDGQDPSLSSSECLTIMIPPGDPVFNRKRCLTFTRSASVSVNGRREQINDVTGFVDASPVYGSSESVARSLRSFRSGLLKSGQRPAGKELLPTKQSDSSSVDSGDSRTNMIPSLISVHVILLRLHNRLASDLASINPHWDDETLYQEARRIVIALVQQVTYRELLSSVLGGSNLDDLRLLDNGHFDGYDSSVNPSIDNGFAVAAYRFGHSLVGSRLRRLTPDFRELSSPSLSSEFFNVSSIFIPGQVDHIVLGLLNQRAQMADSTFTNQIHHHLFSIDGTGSDLYAINIQRGRDHGLPGYTFWRQFCGFPAVRSFQDLRGVLRPGSIAAVERVYEHVNDIDLYAGGMAELPLQGAMVGPTFACVIGRQFSNLKRGDRFWYENSRQQSSFSPAQLNEIRRVTLSRIICENGEEISRIQPEAMKIPGPGNPLVPCNSLPTLDLRAWSDQRENDVDQRPNNNINNNNNNQGPNQGRIFEPPPEDSRPQFQQNTNFITRQPQTQPLSSLPQPQQRPQFQPQLRPQPLDRPIPQETRPRPRPRPRPPPPPQRSFPTNPFVNSFTSNNLITTPSFDRIPPQRFFTPVTPRPSFFNPPSRQITPAPNFNSGGRQTHSHEELVNQFLQGTPQNRPFHVSVGNSQSEGVSFRVPGSDNDVGPFGFVVRF